MSVRLPAEQQHIKGPRCSKMAFVTIAPDRNDKMRIVFWSEVLLFVVTVNWCGVKSMTDENTVLVSLFRYDVICRRIINVHIISINSVPLGEQEDVSKHFHEMLGDWPMNFPTDAQAIEQYYKYQNLIDIDEK